MASSLREIIKGVSRSTLTYPIEIHIKVSLKKLFQRVQIQKLVWLTNARNKAWFKVFILKILESYGVFLSDSRLIPSS